MIDTLTQTALIQHIRNNHPCDEAEMLRLHDITYENSGAFRNAYRIRGFNLIIKFPYGETVEDMAEAVAHSYHEIKANSLIRREHPQLAAFLPKLYYTDSKLGVIVMKFYKGCSTSDHKEITAIGELFEDTLKFKDGWDYNPENFGYELLPGFSTVTGEQNKRIVILDLGLLTKGFNLGKKKK